MVCRRRHVVSSALIVALLWTAPPAHAWGHAGHRIIARLAARSLSSRTRIKLAAILGVNDARLESAMADAASWPDLIDRNETRTSRWHFINVPVFSDFSVGGACPDHECILDRIEEMQDRLATNQIGFALAAIPQPPRPMTSQQLAFLIHFIGDIHQPLHATFNGDRGGNCVSLASAITHEDGTTTADLHLLWDIDTVLAVTQQHGGESKTTEVLLGRFKKGAAVDQLTPFDWARESHMLARTAIYQRLKIPPHTAEPGRCANGIQSVAIGPGYLASNVPIVEQRLLQAGIRLSNVLNRICAGNGCNAKP